MLEEDTTKEGVEDIFNEPGKEETDEHAITPGQPVADRKPAGSAPEVPPPQIMPEPVGGSKKPARSRGLLRRFLIILIVIIVVLFLLGAGYMLYSSYFRDQGGVLENINTPPLENKNVSGPPEVITNTLPGEEPETVKDDDGDGLSNKEEKELGTDPGSSDSDKDGLFDLEEVRVYKTKPTNPDSDSDGYKDGDEVYNGFDPNGPGKLRSLKDEINKLKE